MTDTPSILMKTNTTTTNTASSDLTATAGSRTTVPNVDDAKCLDGQRKDTKRKHHKIGLNTDTDRSEGDEDFKEDDMGADDDTNANDPTEKRRRANRINAARFRQRQKESWQRMHEELEDKKNDLENERRHVEALRSKISILSDQLQWAQQQARSLQNQPPPAMQMQPQMQLMQQQHPSPFPSASLRAHSLPGIVGIEHILSSELLRRQIRSLSISSLSGLTGIASTSNNANAVVPGTNPMRIAGNNSGVGSGSTPSVALLHFMVDNLLSKKHQEHT